MRKFILTLTFLGLASLPASAGESSKVLRQQLTQAKQEKTAAMASHQLEAELMKEVKRNASVAEPALARQKTQVAAQK